jgi:glucosamine--fructose-6-phosphate aminotransferase (isomerizing)
MCGIVGYIGNRRAVPIILEGLRRLEYRGYDSAGVALLENGRLAVEKKAGKVSDLAGHLAGREFAATIGIGHTRWATHGDPSDINAHPHQDCKGRLALIHNGIIENFTTIKKKLAEDGHRFVSQTDTEVLAHLIESLYASKGDMFTAVRLALHEVEGTYGILVISPDEPDRIIAARRGSPLVLGLGEGENFLASDAAALVEHTRQVVYLNDDEVAVVTREGYVTKTIHDQEVEKEVEELTFSLEQIEKGGYRHFMLKEIHEQPESLRNAMRGRLQPELGTAKLGGLMAVTDKLTKARRLVITSCGTSWHAALAGKYMLEQIARVPVEVDYASEFRSRNPIIGPDDVLIVISQSGETADTLGALREARKRGAAVVGIVNVVGSTIARETDAGVYIHAGPEIGVASTKAFTSQIAVLGQLSLLLGQLRGTLGRERGRTLARDLAAIPDKVEAVLALSPQVQAIANEFRDCQNFLYLGRGSNFPTALEGALKLKEISYIHAEGYPAAEMKHGPIALIDENMPVVFIVPRDTLYEKVMSNLQEVRARKGRIIAIANDDDDQVSDLAEHVIRVPRTLSYFGPIVNSVPLQLLAYYTAVARGCDVDQPRNLAKSVTVE